jgi:hypothetical protein
MLRLPMAFTVLLLGSTSGRAQFAWVPGDAVAGDWSFNAGPLATLAKLRSEEFEAVGQVSAARSGDGEEKQDLRLPDNPQLNAAFVFELGTMYVTNATTQASKTTNGGVGGIVDFENVLGLNQEAWVPFLSARWRFAENWRLEAEYFTINRSATHTIGENINWDGTDIPAGSQVKSYFDFTDLRVSAGWSFYKTQDKELGIALGLHVEDIRLNVSTNNTSNGDEQVVAPLPLLSLFGGFAMSDHWSVAARFDAFKITWDPYTGHLYDTGLDVIWNPWRSFGLGLGYRSLQLTGTFKSAHYKGELNAAYSGPILYLNVAF